MHNVSYLARRERILIEGFKLERRSPVRSKMRRNYLELKESQNSLEN